MEGCALRVLTDDLKGHRCLLLLDGVTGLAIAARIASIVVVFLCLRAAALCETS